LKKKNQKNFSPLWPRHCPHKSWQALAKQSSLERAPDTAPGLKLPSLAANTRKTDKRFFGSFFSKKERLPSFFA
jgi:hypothetical protein